MSVKTLASGFVTLSSGKELNIVLHTAEAPSNDEWSEYLRSLKRRSAEVGKLRGLVFSDGGAPNAVQRREMIAQFGHKNIPTAIVTANPLVRGALIALGWFNPFLRSFAPREINGALVHLGVGEGDVSGVFAEIGRLQAALGVSLDAVQGGRPR